MKVTIKDVGVYKLDISADPLGYENTIMTPDFADLSKCYFDGCADAYLD